MARLQRIEGRTNSTAEAAIAVLLADPPGLTSTVTDRASDGQRPLASLAIEGSAHFVLRDPRLYSPRPGQRRVFERKKVARLERRDGRLALFHSMHDNLHGFEVTNEIDLKTGTIVRAEHVTPRLPYMGICSEPQRKITALLGETADEGLRRRIQTHLGGETGCAQLYDLTSDLLKLLT